jgi:hypothetical protein
MPIGQPCSIHGHLPVISACDRCGDFGCRECIPTGRTCTKCIPGGEVLKPDLGRSFNVAWKDPRVGSKVGWGALCLLGSIFLVPAFILMGYHTRIARREREQPQSVLPEWDGVGELFVDGFKAYLALCLPLLVLYALFGAGLGLLFAVSLPGAGPRGAPAQPPPLFFVAMVLGALLFYGAIFVHMALTPAIQVQYLRTGSVLSAFHLGALWRIIATRPFDYFLFLVIGFVLYMGSAIVGLFATMPFALYLEGLYLGRYTAWLDAEGGTS